MRAHHADMTLGAAIRTARGRTTQQQLAERLGTDQTKLSKWEGDHHRPSLEELGEIERACNRPRGFILVAAGFVELPASLEAAIDVDPRLTDEGRAALRGALAGVLGTPRS